MREARRLGVPIVALVDTNCDPDEADFIIPGNDDAIRSCSLIVRAIADGIAAGQSKVTEKEMAATNGNGAAAQERRRRSRLRRPAAEDRRPRRLLVAARGDRRGGRRPAEAEVVAPDTVDVPAAEPTEEETA